VRSTPLSTASPRTTPGFMNPTLGTDNPITSAAASTKPNVAFGEFKTRMVGLFAAVGRSLDAEGWIMWHKLLGDLPLPDLDQAIARWLTEFDSGFPSIAAIRKLASDHRHGTLLGSDEAFWLVIQALQKHSPYYAPHEFRRALPALVCQALDSCGGPSWIADLATDNRTICAAQFRRAYEAIADRVDRTRRLPESLRPRIANAAPTSAPAVARLAEAVSLPARVASETGGD